MTSSILSTLALLARLSDASHATFNESFLLRQLGRKMPAYVISEVIILDERGANSYRNLAAASIEQYNGRYLSRGLQPTAAEGTWPADAVLILVEFPDMATAQRWYSSPEYAEALGIRATTLDRRLLFIEGTNQS